MPTHAQAPKDQYDLFTGFTSDPNQKKADSAASRLKPVNWDAVNVVPSNWVVFSSKAVEDATKAKKHKAEKAAAKPLSLEEAQEWRLKNQVTVFGDDVPTPMTTFDMATTALPKYMLAQLRQQGFTQPTPIQAQTWPIVLSGRDMVGIAKTGSGKTLAFIVPAIVHISLQGPLRPDDGPIAVVLAPTRELAQQTEAEAVKVLPQGMRCAVVYGGAPKSAQIAELRAGVHILVATPGRLIDFLESKKTNLLRATYLVLDEADRMLDMGFEPQVRAICSQIRLDRQTLMFSATWPKEIQDLAATFQRAFLRIHVGSVDLVFNPDVRQHFRLVSERDKLDELTQVLSEHRNKRVLVFTKMKKTTDDVEQALRAKGVNAFSIHGDKEQRQREYILQKFRRDADVVLVATDVAGRGLDIKDLDVVVNYDFPMSLDDFVHRVGRTGRAGVKGDAVSFITKREEQLSPQIVQRLIKLLEDAKQSPPSWMVSWSQEAPKLTRSYQEGQRRGLPVNLRYRHSTSPTSKGPSFSPEGDDAAGAPTVVQPPRAKRPRAPSGPASFFGIPLPNSDSNPKKGKSRRIQ